MDRPTLDTIAALLGSLATLLVAVAAWWHSFSTARAVEAHAASGHADPLTLDASALLAARREGLYALAAAYSTALDALNAAGDQAAAARLEALGSAVGELLAELNVPVPSAPPANPASVAELSSLDATPGVPSS